MKKYIWTICMSVILASLCGSPVWATTPPDPEDQAEILLRALFAVGDHTIKKANQHCNLGNIYLHKINPEEKGLVKIKEPLIALLAAMSGGGEAEMTASCDASAPTHCSLELSRAKGDDASSTEYRFVFTNGKIDPATVECVSTP